MFYELRRYTIRKGKMKQWLKLMEQEIIPFQMSMGMVIYGSFTVEKSDTLYLWLRRFGSEAERKRLYAKVYGSAHWKKVIDPKVKALLDIPSIVVERLSPTAVSVLQ
ncbi:MAG: NIPSNAP family containing protein [Spirochaetes bacterium GWB1_66_5]|nr:MAG: NIPSNAP family containing protein [Spirochaetes bacterium GWB1_66_5]